MNLGSTKLRLATLTLLLTLLGAFVLAPLAASAQPSAQAAGLTAPVTGTFTNAAGPGTFAGTLAITRFANQGGRLVAIGTLSGTLTDATGATLGTASQAITAPVAAAQATCPILNLTLGPLDLNLLGLQVHLDRVVLNITAVPGAGNLLGNLLCAVANLLNGGAPLGALAGLLNRILTLL